MEWFVGTRFCQTSTKVFLLNFQCESFMKNSRGKFEPFCTCWIFPIFSSLTPEHVKNSIFNLPQFSSYLNTFFANLSIPACFFFKMSRPETKHQPKQTFQLLEKWISAPGGKWTPTLNQQNSSFQRSFEVLRSGGESGCPMVSPRQDSPWFHCAIWRWKFYRENHE